MNAPAPRPHPLLGLRFSLAVFALALCASFALFAGCGLSTGGLPADADDGGTPCTGAAQCDDDNPCTADACGESGICAHTPQANGPAPAAEQVQGDCQKIVCTGGEPTTQVDNTDVPDSHNPCIADSCNTGMPVHDTMANDGSPCTTNGVAGACTSGKCVVVCKAAGDCVASPANPCVSPSCDGATGTCSFPPVSDGTPTPGVTQTAGDCHVRICLGGTDTNQEDDSDVPAKMGDCQDPKCTSGTPSQTPHAVDSPCSTNNGQVCDGAGNCVQCNPTSTAKCPGKDTDCEQRTCTNHTCGIDYQPNTTAAADQSTATACHQVRCDGMGGYVTVVDDNVLPVDTTSGCQPGVCTNGVPSHNTAANGSACGNGLACLAGMCSGCTKDTQCQPPAYDTCGGGGMANVCGCTPVTCSGTKTTCGSISNGCGTTSNCNDGKQDGSETDVDCGGGSTTGGKCATACAQGKQCKVDGDCATGHCADGVCCDTACTGTCVACTAAKKGPGTTDGTCGAIALGSDPDNECPAQSVSTCGDSGACNGAGACSTYASGTVCQMPSCSNNVLTKAETCTGGACTAPNPATQPCSPYLCQSGACTTTCNTDGDCASGNYCNSHVCTAKLMNGTACSATNQCTSGFCADGVCCDTACNTACQACSAALKQSGANGTCGNAKNGTADALCPTTTQASCGTDGKCSNGACEDWPSGTVCLNPVCNGPTQETTAGTCNGTGTCTPGTAMMCAPYVCSGTACLTSCAGSDGNCVSGDYCNAGNTCQPKATAGGSCSAGNQCTSPGICLGSVCCASSCNTSGACGATGCSSTDGSCTYPSGSSCGTSCGNGMLTTSACDSNGSCITGSPGPCTGGYLCSSATACASSCGTTPGTAACQSGYYCDGVSPGTCKPQVGSGSTCTQDYQCKNNGTCTAGMCM